jgi:lysophospholipase L1-like esterase
VRVATILMVLAAWVCILGTPTGAAASLSWRIAPDDAVRVVPDGSGPTTPVTTLRLRPCAVGPKTFTVRGPGLSRRVRTSRCTVRIRLPREGTYRASVVRGRGPVLARARLRPRLLRVVALGDSFASGEGVPDQRGLYVPQRDGAGAVAGVSTLRRARWADESCHRSSRAVPRLAVASLADRRSHVTLVHLACTGAEVKAGLLWPGGAVSSRLLLAGAPQVAPDPAAQLPAARRALRGRRADAVVLSVGGNDIGFGGIVATCATSTSCQDALAPMLDTRLTTLDAALAPLGKALTALAPPRRVLLVPYPDIVSGPRGGECAAVDLGIEPGEAVWAASAIGALNATLRGAAVRHGWQFVERAAGALAGRGVCAGDTARVISLSDSVVRQGTETGTLHPDAAGQRAIANALRRPLARALR